MGKTCHVGMDDGVAFHVTNLGRGPSRRMCQAKQISSSAIGLGISSARLCVVCITPPYYIMLCRS